MTNREFYKEQILDAVCTGHSFGFDKTDNMIHACCEINCEDCLFNSKGCSNAVEEWCNAEYIEPCPFEEGELVEVSDDNVVWYLEFFSHTTSNSLLKYATYVTSKNSPVYWKHCQKYGTLGNRIKEQMNEGVDHDNT